MRVAVGQGVAAGETLGEVGSSGCSTAPHLHFEVRGPDGAVVDPFRPNLWADPPPYENALTVMDLVVQVGPIGDEDALKDPPPNAERIFPHQTLGIGLSLAGGSPGERIEVLLEGAVQPEILAVLPGEPPHGYQFWNLPPPRHHGTRRIVVRARGQVLASHELR